MPQMLEDTYHPLLLQFRSGKKTPLDFANSTSTSCAQQSLVEIDIHLFRARRTGKTLGIWKCGLTKYFLLVFLFRCADQN